MGGGQAFLTPGVPAPSLPATPACPALTIGGQSQLPASQTQAPTLNPSPPQSPASPKTKRAVWDRAQPVAAQPCTGCAGLEGWGCLHAVGTWERPVGAGGPVRTQTKTSCSCPVLSVQMPWRRAQSGSPWAGGRDRRQNRSSCPNPSGNKDSGHIP